MRDQAFAEEGGDAAARAIEELIGDDEVERPVFFLERADRAERDDALDAQRLHAVDVGAEVEFAGRNAMAASVAREKGHPLAAPACRRCRLSDGLPKACR